MVTTSGSASYDVTHSGAVTTDPTEADGIPGPGKKSQQVQITRGNKIVFSSAFAQDLDPLDLTGSEIQCFPRAGDGSTTPIRFSGAINPVKKKSKVTGQYFFRALGTDGATEFKYQILLTGKVKSGPVPDDPTRTWSLSLPIQARPPSWNGTLPT